MEDKFTFKDFGWLALFISTILLIAWSLFGHDCPRLDNPNDPFVVKKIKESWTDGYARYSSNDDGGDYIKSPKSIILKVGAYNIGDTIKIDTK